MPARKIKQFLDSQGIKYVTITHSPAYTAQEVAASAHISGRDVAKTVVVKLDGKMALAVMPANRRLDYESMAEASSAKKVELASEDEFSRVFSDLEIGAVPPLGNLYNLPVYVDESLTDEEQIAFSAGTHTEVIRMSYANFEKLVNPTVGELSHPV